MCRYFIIIFSLIFIINCSSTQKISTPDKGKEWTIQLPGLPDNAQKLVLVRIPAGTFIMGSPDDEVNREENEGPQHRVTLTNDFYLGKFEVTQAQWEALMDENPSTEFGPNLPVNRVSWYDAQEYMKRLCDVSGIDGFRLPTEAEREYAARASAHTAAHFSNIITPENLSVYAWYRDNAEYEIHHVGTKEPNQFGLYDMLGNVWEWTNDWYGLYTAEAKIDPMGPETGEEKVIRGGSWGGRFEWIRSADRGKFPPESKYHTGGFRVAWSD
jgi:formylglycine-generating enzyme required for sulfatase activity